MIALTNLRAQVLRNQLPEAEILARALELDHRAQLIMADAPFDWAYETFLTNKDPELIYKGCYHVY